MVLRLLDSMSAPAIVRNGHLDHLAANPLGRALYAPLFDSGEQPANSARFTFLDPAAQDFYIDCLSDLVGERSPPTAPSSAAARRDAQHPALDLAPPAAPFHSHERTPGPWLLPPPLP
jgi:hypothetical protein